MKSMVNSNDCSGYEELDARMRAGDILSEDQQEMRKAHLASCEDCRAEAAILDLVGEDSYSPLPSQGELDRRRYISDVLDGLDASRDHRDDGAQAALRKTWLISAGIAAAAVLAGVLVGVGISGSGAESPNKAPMADASDGQRDAIVILSTASAASRNRVDTHLSIGQTISSGNGQMVLSLATGIEVLLEPETAVRLHQMDGERIALALDEGEVTASVRPRTEGPAFVVQTPQGQVKVTGTVFSARTDGVGTSVAVLRGSVEVRHGERVRCKIQASQQSDGPAWAVVDASDERQRAMWSKLEVLDVLSDSESVVLELATRPSGAAIYIDGKQIGNTPMVAKVRKGYRMLRVEKDGFQEVSEQLDAHGEKSLERLFVLSKNAVDEETVPEETKVLSVESSRPSAEALLASAQEYRIKGQWKNAARAYGALIRTYPSRGESRVALVSLGKLELNKLGKPHLALKRFNQYLKRGGGPLAQEALYSKASALRALGRTSSERSALESFVKKYPAAVETPAARARLKSF